MNTLVLTNQQRCINCADTGSRQEPWMIRIDGERESAQIDYIYIYIINLNRESEIFYYSDSLRLDLNINQWRSTKDYIKWFEEYDKNDRCSFIKYDIKDFYP